ADVDDVTNALTGVSLPLTAADAVGEIGHFIEHSVDIRYNVLAIDNNGGSSWRTQRNVQHSSVLGDVDLVAAKHRVDALAQTGLLRQFNEQPHCFFRDAVFRVIEIHTNRLRRQPLATLRIISEEIAQTPIVYLLVVRREAFPRGPFGERFNRRLHAAPPFIASLSVNRIAHTQATRFKSALFSVMTCIRSFHDLT